MPYTKTPSYSLSSRVFTDLTIKYRSSKKSGSTLEDLYREVNEKNNLRNDYLYGGKNAKEIESMMMQNRKLIEAQRTIKK